MPPQNHYDMDIKLKKEEDGTFTVKKSINYWKGGPATVSVECDNHGYDESLLKKEAESFLNQQALTQGMIIEKVLGPQTTIPVKVERGESARVKRLDFPINILPDQKRDK